MPGGLPSPPQGGRILGIYRKSRRKFMNNAKLRALQQLKLEPIRI